MRPDLRARRDASIRPFGRIYPPVWSHLSARLVAFDAFLMIEINVLRSPESELKEEFELCAVDKLHQRISQ